MLFVQTNSDLFGRIRIRSDEYVISLDKRDLPSPQLFPYLKSLKDLRQSTEWEKLETTGQCCFLV